MKLAESREIELNTYVQTILNLPIKVIKIKFFYFLNKIYPSNRPVVTLVKRDQKRNNVKYWSKI